jgi:hypothetical protein
MGERNPFRHIQVEASPRHVRNAIFRRVEVAQKRASLVSLAMSLAVEVVAVTTAFFSFSHIAESISSSGVSGYVSILLTDGVGTLAYSRELILSIVESMPVLACAGGIAALLFVGWSTLRVVTSPALRFA